MQREIRLVAREPALEDQEHPQPHRVVLAARCMLADEPCDRLGADQPAAREARRTQRRFDVGLQFLREPALERHHEALLLPVDDVARKIAFRQRLQDEFGGAAVDLQRRIEPRAPAVECVIEIRDPRLQRKRHRGAVHFREQIVGQPQARVDVEQVVEVRGRIALVVERLGAIGDAGPPCRGERRREIFAPQQHVEDIGDRRVPACARLCRRLEDPVARDARRQAPQQRGQRRARRAEDSGDALLGHALHVIRVATEHLVGAFAGQDHGDLAPRILREQHRRQRRLVAERLVEHVDPALQRRQHVIGRHHQAVMPAADVPRNAFRFLVLAADVVAGESEIERVERAAGAPCCHRRDDARIDAAADERAERNVGDQHRFDRARELALERVDGGHTGECVLRAAGGLPEFARRELAAGERQPVACRQLADGRVRRVRRRDVLAFEIQRERVPVDRVREAGKRPQRLQLGAEGERAAVGSVVERLDAEVVAREEELAARRDPTARRRTCRQAGRARLFPTGASRER